MKLNQAFSVFSNIYTKANLHRSSELIDYNHVIHTISLCYVWDNVYLYNKDFRMHIAWSPERNWSIILQQAWSLRLTGNMNSSSGGGHSPGSNKDRIPEPCKRYNRRKCNYGTLWRYEHHCSYCLKFRHTILTCRKLLADQERVSKHRSEGNSHSGGHHNGNHSGHNCHSKSNDKKIFFLP